MQTLTGTNTTDPTITPTASVVLDGDPGNAANLAVTPLQAILNAIGWLRKMCALLNMGGGVITNHGTPSAATDVANKGYVDGKFPVTNASQSFGTPVATTDVAVKSYVDSKFPVTNTGQNFGTPVNTTDVAVKSYVDGKFPVPAGNLAAGAAASNLGFTPVQQGGGAGQGTNKIYLGWDGTAPRIQVDGADQGQLATRTYVGNQLLRPGALGASNPGTSWSIGALWSTLLPGHLVKVSGYATSGSGTFVCTLPYAPSAVTYFVCFDKDGNQVNGCYVDASGGLYLTQNATGGHSYYFEISFMANS